jgi:hypothetical protein
MRSLFLFQDELNYILWEFFPYRINIILNDSYFNLLLFFNTYCDIFVT